MMLSKPALILWIIVVLIAVVEETRRALKSKLPTDDGRNLYFSLLLGILVCGVEQASRVG